MSDTLADRLKLLIGQGSVNAFAARVGVSQSVMVKYLNGAMPSFDRACRIAEIADVSIYWLATGDGEMGTFRPSLAPVTQIEDSALTKIITWMQARWRYLGEKDREWLETAVERVPDFDEWQKKRAPKSKTQSNA